MDTTKPSPLDPAEVRLGVLDIIIHPGYLSSSSVAHDYDIAAILVSAPGDTLCRKNIIWPVCYPSLGDSYAGVTDTEVTGWGSTLSVGIGLAPVLRKTTVVPVTNQECSAAMGAGRISERMVCAGAAGKDTCQGDSGGSLTSRVSSSTGYSLVGTSLYNSV